MRFERDALMQVLFNLVDNAVKYAARRVAADEIALRVGATALGVELAVRDHGPGVAAPPPARASSNPSTAARAS